MGLILMAATMIGLIALLPAWPYSRRWGFAPSGVCAVLLLLVLMLMLFGVLWPPLWAE